MAEPEKRKTFLTPWEKEYFFKEVKRKYVRVVCNETCGVIKNDNVRQHKSIIRPTRLTLEQEDTV